MWLLMQGFVMVGHWGAEAAPGLVWARVRTGTSPSLEPRDPNPCATHSQSLPQPWVLIPEWKDTWVGGSDGVKLFLKKAALGYVRSPDRTEQELLTCIFTARILRCLPAPSLCFPALNPVVLDLKGPANMGRIKHRPTKSKGGHYFHRNCKSDPKSSEESSA